jgi:hypothetical protein
VPLVLNPKVTHLQHVALVLKRVHFSARDGGARLEGENILDARRIATLNRDPVGNLVGPGRAGEGKRGEQKTEDGGGDIGKREGREVVRQ